MQHARVGRRRVTGRTLSVRRGLQLSLLLLAPLGRADTALLASVGGVDIDVPFFTRRASLVAPFQWAQLGDHWPERRRRFLEEVLIPEALLSLAAEHTLSGVPAAADLALTEALYADLQAQVAAEKLSPDSVAEFYAQNQAHYATPRTLYLWRILVRTEPEARALLEKLGAPTDAMWSQLARDSSIDEATNMRAGSLGYVASDGQTHMPEVRVSPLLFAAADAVKDGQLVPQPIAEGRGFAVIWRRASRPAMLRSLADVAQGISMRLLDQRLASESSALIERLRSAHLRDHQPERAASYEPVVTDPPRRRLPRVAAPLEPKPVKLIPEPTDRGLR